MQHEKHPDILALVDKELAKRNEKPAFPTRPVANPERRQERLSEQLAEASEKEYEERERSIRTTRESVHPALWLRKQYTNDASKMVCQICKAEMPFKKRDGEYYFEAVEALSKDYFRREHEAPFLALCPLCSAMYKEFVKNESDKMDALKGAIMNSELPEVTLRLGEKETSIKFVESHFHDIKTILGQENEVAG